MIILWHRWRVANRRVAMEDFPWGASWAGPAGCKGPRIFPSMPDGPASPCGFRSRRQSEDMVRWMRVPVRDYYTILGLDRRADKKAIRSAYRQRAPRHHPDVPRGRRASERFLEIRKADEVLSDAERRRRYDRMYREGEPAGVASKGDSKGEVHRRPWPPHRCRSGHTAPVARHGIRLAPPGGSGAQPCIARPIDKGIPARENPSRERSAERNLAASGPGRAGRGDLCDGFRPVAMVAEQKGASIPHAVTCGRASGAFDSSRTQPSLGPVENDGPQQAPARAGHVFVG